MNQTEQLAELVKRVVDKRVDRIEEQLVDLDQRVSKLEEFGRFVYTWANDVGMTLEALHGYIVEKEIDSVPELQPLKAYRKFLAQEAARVGVEFYEFVRAKKEAESEERREGRREDQREEQREEQYENQHEDQPDDSSLTD